MVKFFPDGSIQLNPKCVVISTGLAVGYWYAPPKNIPILLFIAIGAYVGIAYYDDYFDCNDRLSIDSPLHWLTVDVKPPPDLETRTYGTSGVNR